MDVSITLLSLAERTQSPSDATLTNDNSVILKNMRVARSSLRAAHFIVDVVARESGVVIQFVLENMDQTSGKYYAILEADTITETGIFVYKAGANVAAKLKASVKDLIAQQWRVRVVHANNLKIQYSVGASLNYE